LRFGQGARFLGFLCHSFGMYCRLQDNLLALLDDAGSSRLDARCVQVLATLVAFFQFGRDVSVERFGNAIVFSTVLAPAMLALEPTARRFELVTGETQTATVRLRRLLPSASSAGSTRQSRTSRPCATTFAPPAFRSVDPRH